MIKFHDRFNQLRIERGINYDKFLEDFNSIYGYVIDYDIIADEYIELIELGVLSDLCDYFNVSFNYLLGLSSNRCRVKVSPYDEIIGLASVVFGSDSYSCDDKKMLYSTICSIFDRVN